MSTLKQTPSQTVGPFFAYGLCPEQYQFDLRSIFTPVLAERHAAGLPITIEGRVYDGSGQAVSDAVIEMLQADATGKDVQSPDDISATGFRGFARVGTGTSPEARYAVDTIKPGSASATSAPHIDVIVMMRGMLLHAYTRIYFEDDAQDHAQDAVLAAVPAQRRATLIARRRADTRRVVYQFDIHLQGPRETVFFDL
ncbi:protocatechuate 3,4-dioxygenase subunit alpha [Bordetella petrii]|uniref:protocatechuate 3,4-dioxygenase subunit alpha n=1 Tax=Bordetella petrii TaxID=94624 RepID=UPI001E49F177|nr:protocatechuate 3,4-dioxygenase subunit alpha [Bordetella petrii]MCD0502937.1 protocatechuate 3,4-dioxygenase subunit alpha [Bordetella petrii]